MEIADLKRIAEKDGMTAAIIAAVSEDPDHRFLRHNVSLASLASAYSGANKTKEYKAFLWNRILKGKDAFPALLRAVKSLQTKDFPWEFLFVHLLDQAKTISQFKRAVNLCSAENHFQVNRRRQMLAKDLLNQTDEISALLALRNFVRGKGETKKLEQSLADATANKELVLEINQRIFWRAVTIPGNKLLRKIADNDLFALGTALRDEAVLYLE